MEQVLMKWRAEGIDLLPAYSDVQVAEVIKSLGHEPSNDVMQLYRVTGGMPDGAMDDLCFSLWSFDRLAVENSRNPVDGVLFADFLIDSHLYLFRYRDPEVSQVYIEYGDGRGPQLVAGSVEEFFQLYVSNQKLIGL